jgi:hypothetical protein
MWFAEGGIVMTLHRINPTGRLAWLAVAATCTLVGCSDFLGIGEFRDESAGAGVGPSEDQDPDGEPLADNGSGTLMWWAAFGDSGEDLATTVDSINDQIQMVGLTDGPVDFGGGPVAAAGKHGFVTRIGLDGSHVWSVGTEGTGELEQLIGTTTSSDGAVVVGCYLGTLSIGSQMLPEPGINQRGLFVAWLDADGEVLSSVSHTVMGQIDLESIASSATGQVAVAGALRGSADIDGTMLTGDAFDSDALLLVFDADGNSTLATNFRVDGDNDDQQLSATAFDDAGGLWIAGGFMGSLDLGNSTSLGTSDGLLARVNPSTGALEDALQLGGGSTVAAITAIAMDGERVIAAGSFTKRLVIGDDMLDSKGGEDAFVVALDASLEAEWSMHLGGQAYQRVEDVATTTEGDIVLAGGFAGDIELGTSKATSAGESDAFVAKLTTSGEPAWLRSFGRNGPDCARGLALGPDGTSLVVGDFFDGLSLDDELLKANGLQDAFVAQLER